MKEKAAERPPDIEQIRRNNRRAIQLIILAVVFVGLLILAIVLAALVPRTPEQVSIISNVMVICLIFCPLILCLLPIYLMMTIAAFYTGALNSYTGSKLGKIQSATQQAADSVAKYSEILGKRSVSVRAKAAILNKIISDDVEIETTEKQGGEQGDAGK